MLPDTFEQLPCRQHSPGRLSVELHRLTSDGFATPARAGYALTLRVKETSHLHGQQEYYPALFENIAYTVLRCQ